MTDLTAELTSSLCVCKVFLDALSHGRHSDLQVQSTSLPSLPFLNPNSLTGCKFVKIREISVRASSPSCPCYSSVAVTKPGCYPFSQLQNSLSINGLLLLLPMLPLNFRGQGRKSFLALRRVGSWFWSAISAFQRFGISAFPKGLLVLQSVRTLVRTLGRLHD